MVLSEKDGNRKKNTETEIERSRGKNRTNEYSTNESNLDDSGALLGEVPEGPVDPRISLY